MADNEKKFEEVDRKIDASETQDGGGGGGEAVGGGEEDLIGQLCVIIGHGIGEITSKKGDIYIVKSRVDKMNHPVERFGLAVKGDKILCHGLGGEKFKATLLHANKTDNNIFIEKITDGKKHGREIPALKVIKLLEEEGDGKGKKGEEKDPLIGKYCGIFRDGAYKGKVAKILGKNEFGDYILKEVFGGGDTIPMGRMWFAVEGDCVEIDDGEHERITKISHTGGVFETVARSGYSFTFIVGLSNKCEQPEKENKEEDDESLVGYACVILQEGEFKHELGEISRVDGSHFDIAIESGTGVWARNDFAIVGDCVYFRLHSGGTDIQRIASFDINAKMWLPEKMSVWHDIGNIIKRSDKCEPKDKEQKPEKESPQKTFSSSSIQFCRFVTEQVFKNFNVLDKFGNAPFLNDVIYSFIISTFSYKYSTLNWAEAVDIYNEIWMFDRHQFNTSDIAQKEEYERILEIDALLLEELTSIVPQIANALDDKSQADFIYNAMQTLAGGMPFAFVYDTLGELFTIARIDEESRFIVSSKEHPSNLNYLYRDMSLTNWVVVERDFLKIDEVASLIRKMCKSRSKYNITTTLGNANLLSRVKDVVEQFAKTI